MLDHVDLPVRSLPTSRAFYERALAPLGYRVALENEGGIGMCGPDAGTAGSRDPGGDFWINQSGPDQELSPVHVAFRAATTEQIRAFHAAALAAGGRNNGRPRHRPEYHVGYFAAYAFDPDGNNIEAVLHDYTERPKQA